MPIYEYHCLACDQRVSVFFRSFSEAQEKEPACPECNATQLKRLISTVAIRSAQPQAAGQVSASSSSAQEDPQALARIMRKASRKGDFGDDFKEVASRLEKNESATSIEKSLRKRVGENMEGPQN